MGILIVVVLHMDSSLSHERLATDRKIMDSRFLWVTASGIQPHLVLTTAWQRDCSLSQHQTGTFGHSLRLQMFSNYSWDAIAVLTSGVDIM